MNDLEDQRRILGESTVLWAGADGVRIEPGRWVALSGAGSVDYNVALCHGGERTIELTLTELSQARVPAIIMVAGRALADVQALIQAGWICIGATPLMASACPATQHDSDVRILRADELVDARALIIEAFDIPEELATVALPDAINEMDDQTLWGLFERDELVSCAAFVRVADTCVGWSVATPPRLQRHGYAARLLHGAMGAYSEAGARRSLVYASAAGEGLYRALGFQVLERWQMWSRPRWVLARA